MIRSQSRQKKRIMAAAVATCSPTMYARYGDSALDTFRSCAHWPPNSRRDEHGVAQAGNGEEFGDSLEKPDNASLTHRSDATFQPFARTAVGTLDPNGRWLGLHKHVHSGQGGPGRVACVPPTTSHGRRAYIPSKPGFILSSSSSAAPAPPLLPAPPRDPHDVVVTTTRTSGKLPDSSVSAVAATPIVPRAASPRPHCTNFRGGSGFCGASGHPVSIPK